MAKLPKPCIGVCKYRRPGPGGDHCVACSMTKDQKKLSKTAKGRARHAFVALLLSQQSVLGGYRQWRAEYARRCRKKGVSAPFPRTDP